MLVEDVYESDTCSYNCTKEINIIGYHSLQKTGISLWWSLKTWLHYHSNSNLSQVSQHLWCADHIGALLWQKKKKEKNTCEKWRMRYQQRQLTKSHKELQLTVISIFIKIYAKWVFLLWTLWIKLVENKLHTLRKQTECLSGDCLSGDMATTSYI